MDSGVSGDRFDEAQLWIKQAPAMPTQNIKSSKPFLLTN